MRINTNVSSLNAQESTTATNNALSSSLEKLSSGLKINKAADDASGLAIADKLRTQVTSINQAVDNGNSAVSLLQIADKSMAEQSNILDTIKAKLIQANTDTTSTDGRDSIAKDIDKLLEQLDNISKSTNYNGTQLIGDTAGTGSSTTLTFQVGEDADTGGTITLGSITANTTGLSLTGLSGLGAGALTKTLAKSMQAKVDSAITSLNEFRADIGSTQNQVESAVTNLMTQSTNLSSAESVIRDVDYAKESANFNKQNIIAQAGSYAISQANTVQQNVLKLLQ
ncbi:flagellin [Halarcobacter anaerophilus]|uniref:Flagellin n=1 Tax=Halarcobacter anaerophilus TaxID=877500 RepID=A0A4Q0XXA8_9BACT|nr:flagellin [Halarcobacter anaerophilus]QDF30223.1 flagellin [Halarcobacter anaerophilus]RXJ62216.1 flagellin [Halarcobacter anaerophilus]